MSTTLVCHELSLSTRNRGTQTQLKDGDIVLKLNSKNSSSLGELAVPPGGKVRGRMPRKKTVQSSISSMGFPLLQKPGEMCPGRTERRDAWKILEL